jgi:hypothetical protein
VKNGKSGFFSEGGIPDPPEVVSGFRGGGGGGHWNREPTPVRGWYWKTIIPDPPLVKLRMVRGGPEFLKVVD